jgi:hypothetical protein
MKTRGFRDLSGSTEGGPPARNGVHGLGAAAKARGFEPRMRRHIAIRS